MSFYRNSIIVFGYVLPLVLAGAVIGGSLVAGSRMNASLEEKMTHHKTYEQSRMAAFRTEADLAKQRPHVERWNAQLAEETASSLSSLLRGVTEKLPPKEIQQTDFDPAGKSQGGFGSVTSQKSSQVRLGYRGTYRTMQRALLEVESHMPQMQLQELRISTNGAQQPLLNYQLTYTVWEN